jgi:hypothetical protein
MAPDRRIRASDQDRESTAELLCEAYAVGRLSREEFDERVTAAYSAKTCGELRDLTADLPPPVARTGLPSGIVASRRVPRRTNRGRPRQMTWIYALVFGASLCGMVAPVAAWVTMTIMLCAVLMVAVIGTRQCGTHAGTRPGVAAPNAADHHDVLSACRRGRSGDGTSHPFGINL